MTLTQDLREEATAEITHYENLVQDLENRHCTDAFDAEDEAYDEAEAVYTAASDEYDRMRGEVFERYWRPSYNYSGGSGCPSDEFRRLCHKHGVRSESVINDVAQRLVKRDIAKLEATPECKELVKRIRAFTSVGFFSKDHDKLHREISEAKRMLQWWKQRLKDIESPSWVRMYGKDLAEQQRVETEKREHEEEVEKLLAKFGGEA